MLSPFGPLRLRRAARGRHRRGRWAVTVLTAVLVSGCSGSGPQRAHPSASPAERTSAPGSVTTGPATTGPASTPASTTPAPPAPPATTAPTPAGDCPRLATGFDCDLQRRISAVEVYVRTRPGTVGIVLRDRRTGAVWRNRYDSTPVWTASTIKLAMTVDLLTRDRAGLITLSDSDRSLIEVMLHRSDDEAADTLWFRYAGADHLGYNDRFARYGLTSLRPQAGFTDYYPYWGFQKCTPADLDRLMQYVLTTLDAHDRDYIVGQLQHVAPDQQWGVWGAGPAAEPGNKDGWSKEQGGWVMNSVGFVGPARRFTLAVMNSLNGEGGYDEGRATDTEIARILFAGRF